MTQRILLPLLVCSLLFPSCDLWSPGGDGPGDGDPVLLPLETGNQWVMAFSRTYRIGTPNEGTESYTDTLRVVSDTTIAGERWAEVACTESAICLPEGFYSNRADGVWKWDDPSSDQAPYLLYKYPAEVGDTYALDPCCTDVVTTVSVLGTDTPIETPAGTLPAYHYQFDTDEAYGTPVADEVGRYDRYLAPGQGFASWACSFISLRDGEWETVAEYSWQLIAFEGE